PAFNRLRIASLGWYVVPVVYVFLSLKRYLHRTGSTYQESVLRKTWSVRALLSDLAFNVRASISFWSWTPQKGYLSEAEVHRLAAFAVMAFVVVAMIFIFYKKRRSTAAA